MGEHAERLKGLEAGLGTRGEAIKRLRQQAATLEAPVARLLQRKADAIKRAVSAGISIDRVAAGGGDGVEGMDALQALAREQRERRGMLEQEKDHLQSRCRQLQVDF